MGGYSGGCTIQGAWYIKTTFLPSPLHWIERSWVRTPRLAKVFQFKLSILEADIFPKHTNFPISLPSNTTCSFLPRSFHLSLPFSSWILKQVVDTFIVTYRLSYLSVVKASWCGNEGKRGLAKGKRVEWEVEEKISFCSEVVYWLESNPYPRLFHTFACIKEQRAKAWLC